MIVAVELPAAAPTNKQPAKPINAKQVAITFVEMAEYSFTLKPIRHNLLMLTQSANTMQPLFVISAKENDEKYHFISQCVSTLSGQPLEHPS